MNQEDTIGGLGGQVKVTEVKVFEVGLFTYVKIHTDTGVTGSGEMHPASNTAGNRLVTTPALQYCAEYLVGKDPTEIERHWQHLFRRSLFRGGADSMAAIAAIDMALWDIAGKLVGLPTYKLLGGPTREKVRLFAALGGGPSPEALAEQAVEKVEQGFTAVRFNPFRGNPQAFADMGFNQIVRCAERFVGAARKAVGDEIDLSIDVIGVLSPAEAIAVGQALAPYGLHFFEDPIEPDNIDAMAQVAAALPMPVATGERHCTIHQFRDLLNRQAAKFLRPDPALAGGLTNCKKIAALAEADYVQLMPHNPLSCVLTAACVQLDASIHNFAIQEYQTHELEAPRRDLVQEPIELRDGYLIVPDKPGIGIELNEEAFKHYPPISRDRQPIIGHDGGLRDY